MMFAGPRAVRVRVLFAALMVAAGCGGGSAGADFGGYGGYGGYGGGEGGYGGGEGGWGGEGGSDTTLHAAAIAAGTAHTCALVDDGRVVCWGDGTRGQLGDGSAAKDHHRVVPGYVKGISGAIAVRAGGNTSCAILAGGSVACWGDGAFGQLGDGIAKDGYFSALPVGASGLTGVIDLSVTGTNACAALKDGGVRCWGRNSSETWLGFTSSDCGPYTVTNKDAPPKSESYPCESAPRAVPGAKGAVGVVSGGVHNCLRQKDGSVRCWGSDQFGQLGDGYFGSNASQADPVAVGTISDVRILALGASHTCAVAGAQDGVRCWGDNSYGQLGIGTASLESYQVKPVELAALSGVVDLQAAARTTCAARVDGSVLCWGATSSLLPKPSNSGGALVPTPVPGVTTALRVAVGGNHACAVTADASVVCWGSNERGQLGTGGYGIDDFTLRTVAPPFE